MSASSSTSSPVSTRTHQPPPFDFSIVPSAPRSARRWAPFVVVGGFVIYAFIVVTALTGPSSAGDDQSSKVTSLSGQMLSRGQPHSAATVG